MRRRLTTVFVAGIAALFLLALAALLVLWPQLQRAEALSSRYAANSRLVAEMGGAVQIIRSSATQHHVRRGADPRSAPVTPRPLDELDEAKRRLVVAATLYEKTPMDAAELEIWAALSRKVFPEFLREVDDVLAQPSSGATIDQDELDELRLVTNRAVVMLQQLAELNAGGLDATGKRMHSGIVMLVFVCVALATLGTAGAVLLVRWALRAVDEYERSTTERIEELDQFAGRVAHDLRNPLQAIGMSLSVLQQRAADEQTRRLVERARGAAQRMGAFIQELLQFARSGANPSPGASARVDDVLRTIQQDLAPSVDEKRITLSIGAPAGVRAAISPEALRAIVGNLADNAIKHMPVNGADRRVELRADRLGDEVRITVRDTGSGIAPNALPRLFEPFFRATTRPGGFGIGLKTVKRLVDAHRGQISVESRQGHGSVFTVVLPSAPATSEAATGGDPAMV
jgi:nitrogen-specific signal transduction histidine kinase